MSVFSVLLAMLGFLLFHSASLSIIFVVISAFCFNAATRAYNSIKDVKEDAINRKRVNPFVHRREGKWIIGSLYVAGFASSLFLGTVAIAAYILVTIAGISYTLFSMNARSFSHLLKNFYSGANIPLLMVMGAGLVNAEVLVYYFVLGLFIFLGSVISDLRDYSGDKQTGKRSLATVYSYGEGRLVAVASLLAFDFLVVGLSIFHLALFVAASFVMIALLFANKPRVAHISGGLALMSTVVMLLL